MPDRDDDREDDVAELLFPRCDAHDAAHGLNHIDLRIPRREEEHGIQRGHIDAFD
jgi:hypothetical protein